MIAIPIPIHTPHACLRAAKMFAKGTLDREPTGVHAAQMRLDPSPLRWVETCRGQHAQQALPPTTMTEDLFHNVSLAALDETDDFHS